MKNYPSVSIIIPTYNEEKYIYNCITSIINNNYPIELLEIIVVDGESTDNTVEVVRSISKKINIIKNNKRIIPVAINLGIRNSSGDIIIRADAHAIYDLNYIKECVESLQKTKATNVGGCIFTKESSNSVISKCIALVLSHPFGVGNSSFRIRNVTKDIEVDTVPFGAFRRKTFFEYGLYNENMERNEDLEFNGRIRKRGGKILLSPKIKSTYYARRNIKGLWKQSYNNGKWNILTIPIAYYSLSIRHFVPLIFVTATIGSGILSIFSYKFGGLLLCLIWIPYLFLSIFFSFKIARNEKKYRLFFVLPYVFLILHVSYGIGTFFGFFNIKSFLKHYQKTA